MSPAGIDDLIRRVEAGEEVRLIMPYGWIRTLGDHDLDDLYIARHVSALLEDAAPRLDALVLGGVQ